MSREIKFRAWNKLARKMACIDTLDFMLDAYRARAGKLSGSGHLADIELMQFTGLFDKAGKEIYEGDIVEISNPFSEKFNAPVSWGKVKPMYEWMTGETWLVRVPNGGETPLYPYCQPRNGYTVSIAGNIYEHPHLIEQKAGVV